MKHRKQTQHIRRYRSGRWTCVNRGIKYKLDYTVPRKDVKLTMSWNNVGDYHETRFLRGAHGTVIAKEGDMYLIRMYTGDEILVPRYVFE